MAELVIRCLVDLGLKPFREEINYRLYIITDKALMKISCNAFLDGTNIGSPNHYLVWFELGSTLIEVEKSKGYFV